MSRAMTRPLFSSVKIPRTAWSPSENRWWDDEWREEDDTIDESDLVPFDPKYLVHPFVSGWRSNKLDWCKYVWPQSDRRQAIRCELTSYTYMGSFGAMHFYARFHVLAPSVRTDSGGLFVIGGYGPKKPKINFLDLDVQYVLTGKERDADGEPIGEAGKYSSRFETPETALQYALSYAVECFSDNCRFEFIGFGDVEGTDSLESKLQDNDYPGTTYSQTHTLSHKEVKCLISN